MFPATSLVRHVTNVEPRSNTELEGGEQTDVTALQLSVAVAGALNATRAVHVPLLVLAKRSLGHEFSGACTSFTVMVNEH